MKKFISISFSLLLITTVLLVRPAYCQDSAAESQKESLLEMEQELQTAVDANNRQEIARITYAMEQFFGDESLHPYARYYAAYAWYRLHTLPTDDGNDPKSEFLNSAVEHLEKATEIAPSFADAYALLGSVYGMKATGVFSGMKYGPKSQSAIERAIKLSPDNPRIYLIDGIGSIYKPAMFGGGLDNALESLNKAAELFKEFEPASELAPNWGHAETYAWLGQVYAKQGDNAKAREAYQQALEIDPDYGWVKYNLLPALAEN